MTFSRRLSVRGSIQGAVRAMRAVGPSTASRDTSSALTAAPASAVCSAPASALASALVAILLLVPLGSSLAGTLAGSALSPIAAPFVGGATLHAQAPSATRDTAAADSIYEYGPRTRDGTGKYYMGREISLVMGHQGAGWLERPGREQEERTDLFIERIPVEPGDVVADIGAGTGYFAFPIAERVPEGRVLAVDIQPEMLSIIEERKRERGVENVETVQGTITDPGLPEGEVDVIYIVDAYHEFSHPREMGEAMYDALEPGGQLILLEYRAEDPTVPIKPLHKMSEEQAREEMAVLGFEWVRTDDYLPQQHVLVFEKP